MRVHAFLNHGRAMTLCWTAKAPNRARFTTSAWPNGTSGRESIDLRTAKFLRKPMAYRKSARNARYKTTPYRTPAIRLNIYSSFFAQPWTTTSWWALHGRAPLTINAPARVLSPFARLIFFWYFSESHAAGA